MDRSLSTSTTEGAHRHDDDGERELASRLRAAVVPLVRELRRHIADDLTPSQLSAMGAIFRHGPLAMGEIAERERLSLPMISKIVAALESKGLVERTAAAGDRRVCLVSTSAKGEDWVEAGRVRRDEVLTARIRSLSAEDRLALAAALPALEQLADIAP